MVEITNINVFRGDTFAFGFEIEGLEAQTLDTAYFTCRKSSDNSVVFQKSLNRGIGIVSSSAGVLRYRVRVAPEDTKLIAPGTYRYDLQIGVNSDIFTIMAGAYNVIADQTY